MEECAQSKVFIAAKKLYLPLTLTTLEAASR